MRNASPRRGEVLIFLALALVACGASQNSVLLSLQSPVALTEVVTMVLVDGVEEPRLASMFASLSPGPDGMTLGSLALVTGAGARRMTVLGRALDPGGNPMTSRAEVDLDKGKRVTATLTFASARMIPLAVSTSGSGVGIVTGFGGECRTSCSVMVAENLPLVLTAVADPGATFSAWTGCTSTSAGECTIFPTQGSAVDAAFDGQSFTLTVETTLGAEGSGVVVSTPSRIDCGSNCSARFSSGTQITLTPMLGPGVQHKWRDETCAGQAGACTFTLDGDKAISLLAGRVNYAFVTSGVFSSNLGGLSGADEKCRDEAAAASLPGTFVAWLAETGVSGADRVVGARGWLRPDGRPFFDDLSILVPGPLPIHAVFYPLRLTASGVDLIGELNTNVWTGMDVYGGPAGAVSWDTEQGSVRVGSAVRGGPAWMTFQTVGSVNARLYCFGVDFNGEVAVTPPAPPTRLAFVSQSNVSRAGGIAGADAACAAGAATLGATGMFRALVATTTAAAALRFDPNGAPWRRPDGVLLAATARDFLEQPSKHFAALNQNYLGAYGSASGIVFTGAASPLVAATAADNCDDMTNPNIATPPIIGDANSSGAEFFAAPAAFPPTCMGNGAVYCLEL